MANIKLSHCFTKMGGAAESSPGPLTREEHSSPLSKSILVKNFNSLCEFELAFESTSKSSPDSDSRPTTPDFATAFASQRFFFSSPGRSNSIKESSTSSSLAAKPPERRHVLVVGGIATPTYSPNPYEDFRRSMQEMVEARNLIDVGANWDKLHELLLCYLALNPKTTHKFIVQAFSDLLLTLMASQTPSIAPARGL